MCVLVQGLWTSHEIRWCFFLLFELMVIFFGTAKCNLHIRLLPSSLELKVIYIQTKLLSLFLKE